jgi:hypothetical protein
MMDYIICGWRVRTEIPLLDAVPWSGPDRQVDIEVRPGSVPVTSSNSHFESLSDGRVLLDLSPHVRFLVSPDSVIVDTSQPPEAIEWRARFVGQAFGLLCYLRGIAPLHACSLRIGTRTIAIVGPNHAGKSTIAAALMRRKHVLVTDDICAITLSAGRPHVLPSFPTLKLSADSLDVLGFDSSSLPHAWIDAAKTKRFLVPGIERFDPAPSALDMLYLLDNVPDAKEHKILPIGRADAFKQLTKSWHHVEIGRFLHDESNLFAVAARLVNQVAMRRLVRRSGFAHLPALAGLIEADVIGGD